jgi:hypothetical protein
MPYPKRIKPVEHLSEQAGHRSSQRKILRLKSFDARIEKRDLSPSRSNSPAWSSRPRAAELAWRGTVLPRSGRKRGKHHPFQRSASRRTRHPWYRGEKSVFWNRPVLLMPLPRIPPSLAELGGWFERKAIADHSRSVAREQSGKDPKCMQDLPDAGAAKVTRKKSLLLLPNEPGTPVAKEVASRKHAHASAFLKNLG